VEPLLTKTDAAKALKISERKLELDRGAGLIGCVTIGSQMMFTRSELERYIASQTVRSAPSADRRATEVEVS
jgi:hypothetical protein